MCKGRLWGRASLSIGAPLGNLAGRSYTGDLIYRVRQRIGRFGNGVFYFLRERGRGMMLPSGVAVNSVQFEMESWTVAHRAFAVKSFYKNNDS